MLLWILIALDIVLGTYLLFYSAYWLGCTCIGILHARKTQAALPIILPQPYIRLAILLPAYRPNQQLLKAVQALQESAHTLPFEIFVLLQQASPPIREQLALTEVRMQEFIPKAEDGNPYHQALRHAAQWIWQEEYFTHLVLLDKDNIADTHFLLELETGIRGGYQVVQGKRKPLGKTSIWASYDTLSEQLNDLLFRDCKQALGLAPELSGSAVAFTLPVFIQATAKLDGRAPGMDKNLMVQLLLARPQQASFYYRPQAVVYEEKTEEKTVLQQQRTRWFGNQYFNLLYWGGALLHSGRAAAIDYAISLGRPPRSVQLLLLPLLSIPEYWLYWEQGLLLFPFFSLGTVMTYTAMGLFALHAGAMGTLWRLLPHLPAMALSNLRSAAKGSSRKQQGKFIHTERKD